MYCIFLHIGYDLRVKKALFIFYLLKVSWYKKRFGDCSWRLVSWITCTCHKSHFLSTTKKTHHHRFLSSLSLISIGKGSYCRLQRAVIGVVLAYFRGDGCWGRCGVWLRCLTQCKHVCWKNSSVKRRWIAYLPDAVDAVDPPPNVPCLFTAFRDPP